MQTARFPKDARQRRFQTEIKLRYQFLGSHAQAEDYTRPTLPHLSMNHHWKFRGLECVEADPDGEKNYSPLHSARVRRVRAVSQCVAHSIIVYEVQGPSAAYFEKVIWANTLRDWNPSLSRSVCTSIVSSDEDYAFENGEEYSTIMQRNGGWGMGGGGEGESTFASDCWCGRM